MFNQNASADTKIAVLEERLSAYEVMMNKIDEAIQLMGKTSQNISKMLAVHEEKIDQCNKTDDLISKMLTNLKEESEKHCKSVNERIDKIEIKLDEIVKYRWIIVGVFAVVSFALSQSGMVVDILTPHDQPNYRIETRK
jgi:CRISPR/Cas system CMR subunit Cmr6 (Cas7 group RAMP superfamily)